MGKRITVNVRVVSKRLAVCAFVLSLAGVGGCPSLKPAELPIADADGDGVADLADVCPGFDDNVDGDRDGVPDGCDVCTDGDDALDDDGDGVPDACDVCPGFDDTQDDNNDGIPNGCDVETSFMRADLQAFAVSADTLDPIALSDLNVGDEVELSVPNDAGLARTLQQQPNAGCSCVWSVQPRSAGTFASTTECTTIYTVEAIGDAVIAVVQTCGGVAREFFNGLHAEVPGVIEVQAADPTATVTIAADHCPDDTICIFGGDTVVLDGSDSSGFTLAYQWTQIMDGGGPRVPLVDPQAPDGGCCNPTDVLDDASTPCFNPEICRLDKVQFVAPAANTEAQVSLQFELTVTDEQSPGISLTSVKRFTMIVESCPVAKAASDSPGAVSGGARVILTGSNDSNLVGVGYTWRQIDDGAEVVLTPYNPDPNPDPDTVCCDLSDPDRTCCIDGGVCCFPSVQLDAPFVTGQQRILRFEVELSIEGCSDAETNTDTVDVFVNAENLCAGVTCPTGPCFSSVCVDGICQVTNAADGTSCDDQVQCTTNDVCSGGLCGGTSLAAGTDCPQQDGVFCNGIEVCTADSACVAGVLATNGTPCSDGNICTQGDTCDGSGTCVGSEVCPAPLTCNNDGTCSGCGTDPLLCPANDANVCTGGTALCVANACVYPDDVLGPCDDDDLCTVNDACAAGACLGVPRICDDSNSCTDDSCNASDSSADAQGCVFANNDANTCSDGFSCTSDACVGGVCTATPNHGSCTDGNACTDDFCNPAAPGADAQGCAFLDDDTNTCADAFSCTVDACVSGVCQSNTNDSACDDADLCTMDTCDPTGSGADGAGCLHTTILDCTTVSGQIRRGDDDGTGSGTLASGRTITVEIRRVDDNTLVASVQTTSGQYDLGVLSSFFSILTDARILVFSTEDVRFEQSPAEIIVTLQPDQANSIATDFIAFYDFYVDLPGDGIGVDGDDSNSGTQAAPLASAQAGADAALAGDTVSFKAGTYTPPNIAFFTPVMQVRSAGTSQRPIRFQNFGNEIVVFDAEAILSAAQNGNRRGIYVPPTMDFIEISGLVVRNAYREGVLVHADNVTLENCILEHNGLNQTPAESSGCKFENVNNFTIRHVLARNCYAGITAKASNNGLIEECMAIKSGFFDDVTEIAPENADGFSIAVARNGCDNTRLVRCVSFRNGDDQIDMSHSRDCMADQCYVFEGNSLNSVDGDGEGFKVGNDQNEPIGSGRECRRLLVRRCISFGNGANGIDPRDGIDGVFYNNSTFGNKGQFGFSAGATLHRTFLFNNISFGNIQADLFTADPTKVADFNNWANASGQQVPGNDANSIREDPGWANAGANIDTSWQGGFATDDVRGIVPTLNSIRTQIAANYVLTNVVPGTTSVDRGTFILFAISGSGTNFITVDDDPRLRLRTGDTIQIDGAGTAVILGMTDTAIALDQTMMFTSGAGLHLPWLGASPDMGAVESQ